MKGLTNVAEQLLYSRFEFRRLMEKLCRGIKELKTLVTAPLRGVCPVRQINPARRHDEQPCEGRLGVHHDGGDAAAPETIAVDWEVPLPRK